MSTNVDPPENVIGHRMNPVQPMTVEVLIEILSLQPKNAYVHVYSDAEGNQCHPLLEVETGEDNWVALVPYD